MKKITLLLSFLWSVASISQELNCSIQVLSPTIQGTTEKRIFETLQQSVFEFMNNTKWTKDQFSQEERIECSILITISDKLSTDEFRGSIQVACSRPVFNSSYKSLLFNFNDQDFQFRYLEFQPLEFNENSNTSNLTSVLAYYAYIIIGMDYDSFQNKGGDPYFQKAKNIVNNSQNMMEKGWKAIESTKNRYWLVDNLLLPIFSPLRECMYTYHRNGFDIMSKDVLTARSAVMESLMTLQKLHQQRPLSFNMQLFFLAKSDEVVNLFKEAMPDEKAKLVNLLNEIDPGNSNKYQKIL